MKKTILILIFLSSVLILNSIDFNIINKLSESDLQLLARSYYELGIKYKELGKNDLAGEYLKIAYKIHKNIDKETIYSLSKNKVNNINTFINNFINLINNKNINDLINCFDTNIEFKNDHINISKDELKESIKGWFENNKQINISFTFNIIENKNDKNYLIDMEIQNIPSFFIELEKKHFIFTVLKNSDNTFSIKSIKNKIFKETSEQINTDNYKDNDVIKMFNLVINNKIDEAINFFSDDIWFDEYKMLIPKKNLKEIFIEWVKNNKEKDIKNIINFDSIKTIDDNNFITNINWNINISNFYIISLQFKKDPIIPGNNIYQNYLFLIEKDNNTNNGIVAIYQN